jgi:hypothetical protein
MGYARLNLNDRLTHLRMRVQGFDVRAVIKATGNSASSVYQTYRRHDADQPLLPPISYKVGRPRKLCNDDVDVSIAFFLLATHTHQTF